MEQELDPQLRIQQLEAENTRLRQELLKLRALLIKGEAAKTSTKLREALRE